MYRIGICDDEPVFLRAHEKMTNEILTEANIPHQITAFSSAKALREALAERPGTFDILLLDILLESENGIELARLLRKNGSDVSILFITSSPYFSLEGYSVYPVHYLLKPLQKERLAEALFRDYKRNCTPKSVVFPIKGGSSSAALNSILYIEILNRDVTVHTTERQFIIDCSTLMNAGELVPGDMFMQCHKSFLVNMKNIKDVTKSAVSLTNGESIPVGRAFYREALTRFVGFMAIE